MGEGSGWVGSGSDFVVCGLGFRLVAAGEAVNLPPTGAAGVFGDCIVSWHTRFGPEIHERGTMGDSWVDNVQPFTRVGGAGFISIASIVEGGGGSVLEFGGRNNVVFGSSHLVYTVAKVRSSKHGVQNKKRCD